MRRARPPAAQVGVAARHRSGLRWTPRRVPARENGAGSARWGGRGGGGERAGAATRPPAPPDWVAPAGGSAARWMRPAGRQPTRPAGPGTPPSPAWRPPALLVQVCERRRRPQPSLTSPSPPLARPGAAMSRAVKQPIGARAGSSSRPPPPLLPSPRPRRRLSPPPQARSGSPTLRSSASASRARGSRWRATRTRSPTGGPACEWQWREGWGWERQAGRAAGIDRGGGWRRLTLQGWWGAGRCRPGGCATSGRAGDALRVQRAAHHPPPHRPHRPPTTISETDLDEVLQTTAVFANVSRGVLAKAEDLQAVFGTTDEAAVCLRILKEGDMQVSDKERELEYSTLFKDVVLGVAVRVLAFPCVGGRTRRRAGGRVQGLGAQPARACTRPREPHLAFSHHTPHLPVSMRQSSHPTALHRLHAGARAQGRRLCGRPQTGGQAAGPRGGRGGLGGVREWGGLGWDEWHHVGGRGASAARCRPLSF